MGLVIWMFAFALATVVWAIRSGHGPKMKKAAKGLHQSIKDARGYATDAPRPARSDDDDDEFFEECEGSTMAGEHDELTGWSMCSSCMYEHPGSGPMPTHHPMFVEKEPN